MPATSAGTTRTTRTPAWSMLWRIRQSLTGLQPADRAPRIAALIAGELTADSTYTAADLEDAYNAIQQTAGGDLALWESAEPTVEVTAALIEEARYSIGGAR